MGASATSRVVAGIEKGESKGKEKGSDAWPESSTAYWRILQLNPVRSKSSRGKIRKRGGSSQLDRFFMHPPGSWGLRRAARGPTMGSQTGIFLRIEGGVGAKTFVRQAKEHLLRLKRMW